MHDRRSVARTAALLMLGWLAIHELRYALAFGDRAGAVLAHHGHGYLALAGPLLATAAAVALAWGLVAAAASPRVRAPALRLTVLWPLATTGLLALYCGQELAEGLLAPGHPAGWAGVFGAGGWLAIPLSPVFGALGCVALRVIQRAENRVRELLGDLPVIVVALDGPPRPRALAHPPGRARRSLAEYRAGRGPPVGRPPS